MCYTLANNTTSEKLEKRLAKKVKSEKPVTQTVFNSGFSHPSLYIVKQEEPNSIHVGKWGLVPSFISDESKAKEYFLNTLNAKSETVFERVSFKNSILPRRCLIPATGFFEWRDCNKTKYPYYIKLKDEEIFCFGGIYDNWVNRSSGEITTTFSIITTESNPLMSKIHNLKQRQPLMFTKETENEWLNPTLNSNDLIKLMQPLDEKYMDAYTIKKISPKTVDIFSEDLIKDFEYPELALYED